eukprot:gnl/TRDRNA2_/TRDRNA2_158748_c0_seq2.p1 gnl/TRDRNA2_/TRDRNA2_158748_c0~~gnl/TRDRNA2_/TRDRNA2_158748_c0_seq2.p1  ORF type:complete len:231 (+),score=31.05 gnl/TRDRNA2_/TRDRNA2_158748_c0_seq2:78-770(+)
MMSVYFAAECAVMVAAIFCPFGASAGRLRPTVPNTTAVPSSAVVYRGVFCGGKSVPQVSIGAFGDCSKECSKRSWWCQSFAVWESNSEPSKCATFGAGCIATKGFNGSLISRGSSNETQSIQRLEAQTHKPQENLGRRNTTYVYDRCANLKKPMPNMNRTDDKKMNLEICHDFCLARNSFYFFVTAGTQCFCSDHYEMLIDSTPETCSVPCTGNDKQICGGKDEVSVYIV